MGERCGDRDRLTDQNKRTHWRVVSDRSCWGVLGAPRGPKSQNPGMTVVEKVRKETFNARDGGKIQAQGSHETKEEGKST